MDPTILQRFQNFKLKPDEESGLTLEFKDIQFSHEECERSLIGKIWGEKVANFSGLKNTLPAMWPFAGHVKVREMGVNLYQFVFVSQAVQKRILGGKAWTFDGQYLILKPWTETLSPQSAVFSRIQLWTQVWNIPNHWLSKELGFKFKHLFCDVLDVIIPEHGSKRGRHLNILTEIDLNKPLLRGTKLKFGTTEAWVEFRYEQMAGFCYYCGMVGHSERHCQARKHDSSLGCLQEGQYGDWLKATDPRLGTNSGLGNHQGKSLTRPSAFANSAVLEKEPPVQLDIPAQGRLPETVSGPTLTPAGPSEDPPNQINSATLRIRILLTNRSFWHSRSHMNCLSLMNL